jgi:hypothetical protein
MIYTCYDMIRDCRAGRPEGWSYFISGYVPVIQKLAAHYFPDLAAVPGRIEQVLIVLKRSESSLFDSLDPSPERWFVAELRQRVLDAFEVIQPPQVPELQLDLETLGRALEPFTLLEKQAVWLETMRYPSGPAGVLLRMDPRTVDKVRDKAAGRLREQVDHWSLSLLADTGRQLGRSAATAGTRDCVPAKAFLDVLDGRATWRGREDLEGHVVLCWHCLDHFCRLAEVLELLRGLKPLSETDAAPFHAALGISKPANRGGWRRWLGGS